MMEYNVLVTLHVLLVSTIPVQSKDTLPLGDVPSNGTIHRYFLETVDGPVTWETAAEYCRENYGGGLAVLSQPHVIDPVMTWLRSVLGASGRAWIGGKRLNDVLQSTFYYLNSSSHPPSDAYMYDGDCVHWFPGRSSIDSISNRPCLGVLEHFLCAAESEIYHTDSTTIVETAQVGDRYLYLMKLRGVEVSWYQARNLCLHVGGDLAVGDVSSNLTVRTHSHWIGARRWRWQWIQDDTTDMTFTHWDRRRASLPVSHTAGDYVSVGVSGWVAENDMTTLSKFVCEVSAATPHDTTTKYCETCTTEQHPDDTTSSTSYNTSNECSYVLIYILIIGVFGGGLVVLIILDVVLIVCLRKAKREKRRETHAYENVAIGDASTTFGRQ